VEACTSELIERGHRVECRDLYAAGFNPILSARDLAAVARGKLAKDIKVEQVAIRRADVLTFISPLWWSGLPAILKGYLDRVFCAGLTYVIKGEDYLPGLSGKKARSSLRQGRRRRNSKAAEPCGRYGLSMTKG
jgi:NAD(P)H dehydrogenase (quinone)